MVRLPAMRLTTRLSAFLLAALAVSLLGFSVTLDYLARTYLYRNLDERLNTVLNALDAAVNVESDALEWNPKKRRPNFGAGAEVALVGWVVASEDGRVVDHSPSGADAFPADWRPASWPLEPALATVFADARGWRLAARRLRLEDIWNRRRDGDEPPDAGDDEYASLVLVAGLSSQGVEASVERLGAALLVVSLVIWLLCAVVGRRLSRWALAPLTRMANSARQMTPANLAQRLPPAETGDELAELGAAFNDLLGRLEGAIERQRRFAGDASHQLRTPLTAVLGLVEVTRRRERTVAEYQLALDQVHGQATRMRQIIESLLFLARNEPRETALERAPIDLADWIPRQLERWQAHARAADIHWLAPPGPALLAAQPVLLEQLFDNLLDNACNYTPAGTSIDVSAWLSAGAVGFTVADRGPGIAREDLPHVFEPFFRSPHARRQGTSGAGLGLAVARQIVVSQGGQIDAQSEPGRGASFHVSFPLVGRRAMG